jgi:hypothetical protein
MLREGGTMAFGGMARRPKTLSQEQLINNETVQQEKVNQVVAKQDARYNSMTEEEREKYYMHPSLMTKIKKALRGQ